VTATLAPGLVDLGSFTGYLAVIGVRDLQGDVLDLASMDATVADFQAGRLQWFITDAHSDRASDVVAEVTDAALDATGLRIKASWLATERAQQLRALVRAGVRLGLSIDYFPVAAEPDGKGGRILSEVVIVGGALTPKPANPQAVVVEGKATVPLASEIGISEALPASAPCGDLYATMQAESERRDPARRRREREDELLASVSWPPASFDRQTRLELLAGVAEAKAAERVDAADPMGQFERVRWEQANRYSSDLAAWMERNR
jgi:HK97 family phage prohead protease